jgi:pyruvate kinase
LARVLKLQREIGVQVCAVTQVLDTMVHAPRPTRAEATDVANLVLDGADCILLCDETSRGSDPVLAVNTVKAICRQGELCYDSQSFYSTLMDEHGGFREANLSKMRIPSNFGSL